LGSRRFVFESPFCFGNPTPFYTATPLPQYCTQLDELKQFLLEAGIFDLNLPFRPDFNIPFKVDDEASRGCTFNML